jgi:hypothetical protein
MSGIKRLMEAVEEKRGKAKDIARRAGVLKVCEYHDELFLSGEKEIVEAYKSGNARWDKDSLEDVFESRREMTDYIKEEVEDAAEECWMCAKIREE